MQTWKLVDLWPSHCHCLPQTFCVISCKMLKVPVIRIVSFEMCFFKRPLKIKATVGAGQPVGTCTVTWAATGLTIVKPARLWVPHLRNRSNCFLSLTKRVERMKSCEVVLKFRRGENEIIEKLDISHRIKEVKGAPSSIHGDILHLLQDNEGKPKVGGNRPWAASELLLLCRIVTSVRF